MNRRDELDQLTTEELHHRAVRRARHHLDAGFFLHSLERTPRGRPHGAVFRGDRDVMHLSGQLEDEMRGDGGGLLETLRPFYLDYLERHADG